MSDLTSRARLRITTKAPTYLSKIGGVERGEGGHFGADWLFEIENLTARKRELSKSRLMRTDGTKNTHSHCRGEATAATKWTEARCTVTYTENSTHFTRNVACRLFSNLARIYVLTEAITCLRLIHLRRGQRGPDIVPRQWDQGIYQWRNGEGERRSAGHVNASKLVERKRLNGSEVRTFLLIS